MKSVDWVMVLSVRDRQDGYAEVTVHPEGFLSPLIIIVTTDFDVEEGDCICAEQDEDGDWHITDVEGKGQGSE